MTRSSGVAFAPAIRGLRGLGRRARGVLSSTIAGHRHGSLVVLGRVIYRSPAVSLTGVRRMPGYCLGLIRQAWRSCRCRCARSRCRRAAPADSAMSAKADPPRLAPGPLRRRQAEPPGGNRTPRRALSADLHAPPRSPGRRLQPAEPPHPGRVTPRGGQQHPIRDDRVVRGPDGGRQILRVVGVDQHPRARAPGRTVRPRGTYQISQPGNCRSSSRRRSPCPTSSALQSKQDGHLPAVVSLPPAHHLAAASGQSARTICPLASPRYRAMRASGRPGQMPVSILAGPVPDRAPARGSVTIRPGGLVHIASRAHRPTLWEKVSGKHLPTLISRIGTGIDARGGSRRPATGLRSRQRPWRPNSGNTARSPTGARARPTSHRSVRRWSLSVRSASRPGPSKAGRVGPRPGRTVRRRGYPHFHSPGRPQLGRR